MSFASRPDFEPEEQVPSGILPWLRLMRLPNVFTAVADVAMGYLFVERAVSDAVVLGCLIGASAALYTAGIVFNDIFDFAVDAKERPQRPLPSGTVSLRSAWILAGGLMAVGLLLGFIASVLSPESSDMRWRSGILACALSLCILGYDVLLKKTPLGPVGMGVCRFLNVLLGMSGGQALEADGILGVGRGGMLVAAGIGVYIVGVTMFSRGEASTSRRPLLIMGMLAMTAGVVLLGSSGQYTTLDFNNQIYGRQLFCLVLGLLMLTVLRRCGAAVLDPAPKKVQAAVKLAILSLIWLDAATTLVVAGPAYGVSVAALIIPALWLGRWVYST